MTSGRRLAREQALQVLYEVDLVGTDVEEAIRRFWEREPAEPDSVDYARALVRGVWRHGRDIDERIAAASLHWKISRMSHVDRAILRIAVYEFQHTDDVPVHVAINEAIELGKRFGTSDSGAFVNGILDRIARDLQLLPGRQG